jgi:hypothetical protein
MVRLMFISLLFCALAARAQTTTTVYAATPEGLPNKKQYIFFEYANFFICDSCKEEFTADSMFEKFKSVTFFEHTITIYLNKFKEISEAKLIFGFLTEDKKITMGKGEFEDKQWKVYDPTAEEILNAPYIFNKKVYDHNGNIIAIIEGEEKYGAAWYLLTSKK